MSLTLDTSTLRTWNVKVLASLRRRGYGLSAVEQSAHRCRYRHFGSSQALSDGENNPFELCVEAGAKGFAAAGAVWRLHVHLQLRYQRRETKRIRSAESAVNSRG